MSLNFDISSCVRATSRLSECQKCVDICPVETIEIVNGIPSFSPSECIECGGCVGVCPTEAFSLSNFSPIEFFFKFIDEGRDELLCQRETGTCLSALSVEHLISLALASRKSIKVDAEGCRCGGDSDKLKSKIIENIEEANFILSSISDREIEIRELTERGEKSGEDETLKERRSFLSLKGGLKGKKEFEIDTTTIRGIREKKIPDKRKLLFSLLKRQEKPKKYDILAEDDISFTSQKFIDDSCTNCQICYRICPTGALSSDSKFSVINFDAMVCVKCHLCHDVCETDSIRLQRGFEIKEFFEPTQRTLASFNIKRCNECGNYFTYKGGAVECLRCQIEEAEAIELHQNAKKMNF